MMVWLKLMMTSKRGSVQWRFNINTEWASSVFVFDVVFLSCVFGEIQSCIAFYCSFFSWCWYMPPAVTNAYVALTEIFTKASGGCISSGELKKKYAPYKKITSEAFRGALGALIRQKKVRCSGDVYYYNQHSQRTRSLRSTSPAPASPNMATGDVHVASPDSSGGSSDAAVVGRMEVGGLGGLGPMEEEVDVENTVDGDPKNRGSTANKDAGPGKAAPQQDAGKAKPEIIEDEEESRFSFAFIGEKLVTFAITFNCWLLISAAMILSCYLVLYWCVDPATIQDR